MGLPTAKEAAPLVAQGLTHLAQRTLTWLISRRSIERMLERLFAHPRRLQVGAVLLGLVLVVLSLAPLLSPPTRPPASSGAQRGAEAGAVLPTPQEAAPGALEQEVLAVVAAYNQASITAAVSGRPDAMAPYLTPDGAAWSEVQAEYQRRSQRGETHEPALVRWGVLHVAVNDDSATLETQEQWDDITNVAGQIVSSRRGILTRNTYSLHRSPGQAGWLIISVTSTTLVGLDHDSQSATEALRRAQKSDPIPCPSVSFCG